MAKNAYCKSCPECFECDLRKNYERSPGEYALQMATCRIERDARKERRRKSDTQGQKAVSLPVREH